MLRKSYRNVRNSSRTKKIGQMRVNRGFSGIREAPNAPDLGDIESLPLTRTVSQLKGLRSVFLRKLHLSDISLSHS